MKYIRKTISALISLSVFAVAGLASAPMAYGCSCMMPLPPVEAAEGVDAVFVGEVIDSDSTEMGYMVTFQPKQVWKGAGDEKVVVRTPRDSAACGVNLEVGKRYIVYASYYGEDTLSTNLCTRTHEIVSDSDEDIIALGEGREAEGNFLITAGIGVLAVGLALIAFNLIKRGKGPSNPA